MKYVLPLLLLATVACSTYKNEVREIEKEKAETTVTDAQGLGKTIQDLITNSQTLSEQQKRDLKEILSANKKKADELSSESYQYRAVLVKELLTGKATESRIKILKKNIRKVERLRLKNTFDTVKKISAIVEKHPDLHEELIQHMINTEGRGSITK